MATNYIRWKGTTNQFWSEPLNWDTSAVPSSGDYAVFDESYYTNLCVLDSNYSVKNILTSASSYSGTINLSANKLTVYDSVSAFNILNFDNIITSASTIELKEDVAINATSGHFIKKLIIESGATLESSFLIVGELELNNSSILDSTLSTNILDVRNYISFEIGDESINTLTLYLEKDCIIPDSGTLSVDSLNYFGSSKIVARTYDCDVNFIAPTSGSFSYAASCSAIFVSAGDCIFNQKFTIIDPNDSILSDSILTLDMNSNGNNITFNNGFHIDDYGREFVNIIFPSNLSLFSGDIRASQGIISTSNTENCQWRLIGNNNISLNTYDSSIVLFPSIEKFDSGTVTLSNTSPPNFLRFESVIFGSVNDTNLPTINFNGNNLYSKSIMTIVSKVNSVLNIAGSNLSAVDIGFYKNNFDNGYLVGGNSWSAYATNSLFASGVFLANSNATSSRGYAVESLNLENNTNWNFDSAIPIILELSANPGRYSQQPISAYYSIYDPGEIDVNTISVTNGFGELVNIVQHSSTSATFMVVISGTERFGEVEISASNFVGNTVEFTSLPFSLDQTPPSISIVNYTPPSGVSNNYINVHISINDNCILSGSQPTLKASFNGYDISINDLFFINESDAIATLKVSAVSAVTNGDLYISATDAALNTSILYSSAFSISNTPSQVSFITDPSFKVGSNFINVSAVFEDILGMNVFIPYNMTYNGLNLSFSTILDSPTKVILSASIPSSLGSGYVSVSGYNAAGILTTANDGEYSFIPTLKFGTPQPSNISKTTITVPISAIGRFINNSNYYYARLDNTRIPTSQPTSSVLNILGEDFTCFSFSATVSSISDLSGELIISAGYE